MLDDDYAALDTLGLTTLAYTDGTPEQQARNAELAVLRTELGWARGAGAAGLASADFSSADGVLAVVAAAGNLAVATAALAALA